METSAAWYVISLRPRGQHGMVRAAATALGAGVVELTPLAIRPLQVTAGLDAALTAERCIFTSPNAVYSVLKPLTKGALHAQAFAVGTGTVRALREAGITDVHSPQRMDSEGLIALLGDVAGQRIGLITGRGGRGLLQPALLARGAEITRVDVYTREVVDIPPAQFHRFDALGTPAVVLASSGEAVDTLLAQCSPERRSRFLTLPVVVPSGRLAAQMRAHGFVRTGMAASASAQDMVRAAAQMR